MDVTTIDLPWLKPHTVVLASELVAAIAASSATFILAAVNGDSTTCTLVSPAAILSPHRDIVYCS